MRRNCTQRRSPWPADLGFATQAEEGGHCGNASPRRTLKSRERVLDGAIAVLAGSGSRGCTRSARAAARHAARKNATIVTQANEMRTASTLSESFIQQCGKVQYELTGLTSEALMHGRTRPLSAGKRWRAS